MIMKKVLFLVKNRNSDGGPYSPPFGLLYSAKFVAALLRKHNYHAKVAHVLDGNSIDKIVTSFDPDVVIIEALWVTPEKIRELLDLKRHEHRKWVVRLHSKPAFLSLEGMAMSWLCEMTSIAMENSKFYIAVNNDQAEKELDSVLLGNINLLPNYYAFSGIEHDPQRNWSELHVGCFGALRPLKNTLEQALAAIIYANETGRALRFHVNSTRVEQHAEPVLNNLRSLFGRAKKHKLVEVPWTSHREFLRVVSKMNLGLQVSFSESFNIVSADFASIGVPIVVSEEISWMPEDFMADTTDAFDIVETMKHVEKMSSWVARLKMRRSLIKYNRISERAWLKFLRRTVSCNKRDEGDR
jgi:hypothetical protein